MDNDTCVAIVSGLFNFHAGRFYTLDVVGDLKESLDMPDKIKGLVLDSWSGRELTVFGFTNHDIHGRLMIKRWPIDKSPDIKHLFYDTLTELISAVVLTMKTLPERMLTKTMWKDSRDSDWLDCDGDILGVAISAGLLSKHATFCIGSGEFSVYYDHDEIVGHHFKPPHYINNIFRIPEKAKGKLRLI